MAMVERPRPGIGCLGMLVGLLALVAIVVTVIFVGVIALGIAASVLVIGLIALAIDRVMLALSPKRRERRASQQRMFVWRSGQFPGGPVIETTATDSTPIEDGPGPHEMTHDDDQAG